MRPARPESLSNSPDSIMIGKTFGIETFRAPDAYAEMPGRMSIQTATCFLLLGCELVQKVQTNINQA